MTDQELADKVVALGVGYADRGGPGFMDDYTLGGIGNELNADEFVRDWRVAGALMEKCIAMDVEYMEIDSGYGRGWQVCNTIAGKQPYKYHKANNDSLPRAIIEACVAALEERARA